MHRYPLNMYHKEFTSSTTHMGRHVEQEEFVSMISSSIALPALLVGVRPVIQLICGQGRVTFSLRLLSVFGATRPPSRANFMYGMHGNEKELSWATAAQLRWQAL